MPPETLQDVLDVADSTVGHLRSVDISAGVQFEDTPAEYTHWIEEQRAWREGCAFMDQSYHMLNQYVEAGETRTGLAGEEAIDLFEHLGINDFSSFRTGDPPQAKQFVACNPDGYLIGDCILFYLGEDRFLAVGTPVAPNWIRYHAETGDYDVATDVAYNPLGEGPPADFRFELMGPRSFDIVDEVTDEPFDGIPFFGMETLAIDGHEVYALGHQMSGERGIELFGSYEHHDAIKDAIFAAGEEYDIRQLGSKSYISTGTLSAWVATPVPAIYDHEDLQDYREWLPVQSLEANFAIAGSYKSDDITDYYLTPHAVDYERLIDFDHDFVGKDALQRRADDPDRTKVTLVWEGADVLDAHGSLFEDGETNQYIRLPDTISASGVTRYDEVLKDGDHVGISAYPGYSYNEREMLSIGCIDPAYSEPGTEVTLIWGEEDSPKASVERHRETELTATVAQAPYVQRGRRAGLGSD